MPTCEDFLGALRMRESSDNYQIVNTLNFLGAYQFGEAALVDLGFVHYDGDAFDNNYGGGWTGKCGVTSVTGFLSSQQSQDQAANEWLVLMWSYIEAQDLVGYAWTTVGNVFLTPSGMLAAAHLLGVGALAQFITSGGDADLRDPYGTSIKSYITEFAGYDIPFAPAGGSSFFGTVGNDRLIGTTGNDSLFGGAGNDTYIVDAAGDIVAETAAIGAGADSGGLDTVQSSVSFDLDAHYSVRFVENLVLTGTGNTNATGNALANRLTGNSGSNVLDGGLGIDTMIGGFGNDTYITNGGDTIIEAQNAGIDRVLSSVSLTLGANVENLTLTGASAINGTGNTLNNELTGNGASNTLNGGTGIDTMIGGAGNDTYITNGGDTIIEALNAGTDRVLSSVSLTLGANVENLTLTGASAINGTGNTLDNVLTGNGASNTLNGGTGIDTLIGGGGNDTYITDGGDTIIEALNSGIDRVLSSVSLTLGANIENLTLTGASAIDGTGNALANRIVGNSGANIIDGGGANDILTGGLGNDTFVFNTALGTNNVDRITDFNVVADTIRLDSAIFTGIIAGTLQASAFASNTSGKATDAQDRIIYESDTGRLFFDADGTGGATKVHFATLNAGLVLTNTDFFLF